MDVTSTLPSRCAIHKPPKRQITPSAPMSAPKNTHTTVEASGDNLAAEESSTHDDTAAVLVPQAEPDDAWRHKLHLTLPVDLRDNTVDISAEPIVSLLFSIFPDTADVVLIRGRSHLLFCVDKMPKSPWPVTIGGLPFTINNNNRDGRTTIFPLLTPFSASSVQICTDKSYANYDPISWADLTLLVTDIAAYFDAHIPEAQLCEVMFTTDRIFQVFVANSVKISDLTNRLPYSIAKCAVRYHHEKEVRAPQQAMRSVDPQPCDNVVDDTEYDVLRPGVMMTSILDNATSTTATTTSGVLVRDEEESNYMTAAAHRIGSNGIIRTPKTERIIGTASANLPFTDICLVDLDDSVKFENQPFETGHNIPTQLMRLATEDDDLSHSACYVDSPFSGTMAGVVTGKSLRIENHGPMRFVAFNWLYMGQEEGNEDKVRPPDGACGAPIWNEEGVVIGFYHFYICEGLFAGHSVSVSSYELSKAGFELSV